MIHYVIYNGNSVDQRCERGIQYQCVLYATSWQQLRQNVLN